MSPPTTAGVTRIQSYEIPVETPKAPGQAKAEAVRVLGRLEQLEKAVAQDSVREVNLLGFDIRLFAQINLSVSDTSSKAGYGSN